MQAPEGLEDSSFTNKESYQIRKYVVDTSLQFKYLFANNDSQQFSVFLYVGVSNFLYSTFHLRFPLWHKKWIFCDNRGAVINGFIFEKKRITLKYNFGGNWLNWLCYLAIM